jgi:sec-independent protein translocase protein TatB
MFDIGFFELLVIGVVALLVLGPQRLPMAARTCGLWLGRLRRTVGSIQSEIREELRMEELKRTTAIEKEQLERELREMSQPFSDSPFETGTADKAKDSGEAGINTDESKTSDKKETP